MRKIFTRPGNNEELHDSNFNIESVLHRYAVDQNRIFVWGDIEEDNVGYVISQLHYMVDVKKAKEVNFIIHSCGGSMDGLFAIIDEMIAIQSTGVNISTTVFGNAYSAGACILAMGSKGSRYARPNASIMLHPIAYELGNDYSGNQEKLSKFFAKKNDLLHRMIAEAIGHSGAKYKKFLSDIDKGLWLTAEEAVSYGIVDKILTSPLSSVEKRSENEKASNE